MKRIALIGIVFVFVVSTGCSMKKMTTNVIGKIATEGMVALEDEQDVAFAREASPALIKTLEVLRHGNLKDAQSLALLALSYGQFTFGFVEEDLLELKRQGKSIEKTKSRANLFYRRGKDYGVAALIEKGSMRRAFKSPFPAFQRALKGLGKKDLMALFWTAFNWANWLNLNRDDPAAIVEMPRIRAMIERVIELDSEYYFGAAHAFRGVLAASRPKMLGGDPELARREFDQAMRIAPGNLMTKILLAQYYARQTQDRALFRRTLEEVMNADASALPGQRLANELAKRRAKILLALENKLF